MSLLLQKDLLELSIILLVLCLLFDDEGMQSHEKYL